MSEPNPAIGGNQGRTIRPASDEEIDSMREQYDKCVVKTNKGNGSNKRIHLPDPSGEEGEPYCDSWKGNKMDTKDMAVYPKGYFPFCKSCTHKWRVQQAYND